MYWISKKKQSNDKIQKVKNLKRKSIQNFQNIYLRHNINLKFL